MGCRVVPIFLCFFLVDHFQTSNAYSMAIDLGSDTMKIALVMPRKPLEIVLDSDSQRKTPTAIAFRNKERLFGRAALALVPRSPELVFQSIPTLLGKSLDHPSVKVYLERYPYHSLSYDPATGQLIIEHPNGMAFTIEELIAMLFEYARDLAENHAGGGTILRTVVLTVPNFCGQAERRSLIRAAELAGLDVIQLIGGNTAVALNFGISRYSSVDTNVQYFMFFDVGYASTMATVVSYQVGKSSASDSGHVLSVLGVGFAPTLGTSTFIYLLRDHAARQFHSLHPNIKGNITENAKSMAKLTLEASRVLITLSANPEIFFQVENLFEGQDFHIKITRNELESIAEHAFEQFRQPFFDAIRTSKIQPSLIREIVLMGGGTRIPKVQSLLMDFGNGSDLGKGVNSDEAAVLGAVYQAAARTPGFKVLPFIVREYNPYPIAVFFESAVKDESSESSDSNSSLVHRVLFVRGNPYPQKRAITFNRHSDDLRFFINYVDLDGHEENYLITTNLSQVTTAGVSSVLTRHPQAEIRGVKAHFTLDHSGLLVLTGIDCLLHPVTVSEDTPDQSTLQKLGNKISGLFGSIGGSSTESVNASSHVVHESVNQNSSDSINATEQHSGASNETTTKAAEPILPSQVKSTEKKMVPFTERVSFHFIHLDSPTPTDDHASASKEKLRALREADQAKRDWENSMNELESELFSTRDKLESGGFIRHSTEDELSTLAKLIADYSAWFDEQGPLTAKEAFQEKYDEIRRHLIPIESRIWETENRPRAFLELNKQLNEALNFSQLVKDSMAKFSSVKQSIFLGKSTVNTSETTNQTSTNFSEPSALPDWPSLFTDVEQAALETVINETKSWIEQSEAKLAVASPVERPPILVADIEEKQLQVKREVHLMNKKLMIWKKEVERILFLHAAEQAKATPPADQATTLPSSPPSTTTTDEQSESSTTQPPTEETVLPPPEVKIEL